MGRGFHLRLKMLRWRKVLFVFVLIMITPIISSKDDTYEEYDDDPVNCEDNGPCEHICSIVDGKIACSCTNGYYLDPLDERNCLDIDECETVGKECKFGCLNLPGTYKCKEDYNDTSVAVKVTCETYGCSHGCRDDEEIECTCPDGYDLDENEKNCIDIDECAEDPEDDFDYADDIYQEDRRKRHTPNDDNSTKGVCSHLCINTLGSFYCWCPINMKLSKNQRTCEEIITLGSKKCTHFTTVNNGSIICSCPEDMQLNNDTITCTSNDSKFCTRCLHTCLKDGDHYKCGCRSGYTLMHDGISCRYNEQISRSSCSHGSIENGEEVKCWCPKGFYLDDDKLNCHDVDECQKANGDCPQACLNTLGSYTCECFAGFEFNSISKMCDISDPCSNNVCSHSCIAKNGKAHCICPRGLILSPDTATCDDVDECKNGQHACSHICINTMGSYVCQCPDDFELDSSEVNCQEISKCSYYGCSHGCTKNEDGKYVCVCPEDYIFESDLNMTCVNVLCVSAKCSHSCGQIEDQVICKCPSDMILMNDMKTCTYLNLCQDNNGDCSHICMYDGFELTCDCPIGFALMNETFCTSNCALLNTKCSHSCNINIKEIECDCPEGFKLVNETTCVENLCLNNNGGCDDICTFSEGVVICECGPKKVLVNETKCLTDVCSVDNGGCGHICNLDDDPYCACREGFVLNENQKDCDDVNECFADDSPCLQMCENTVGAFKCSCYEGFVMSHLGECLDVNECELENGGCSHDCFNTYGSFKCICPQDMELIENSTCVTSNQCSDKNGGCSQLCLYENYTNICRCFEGYALNNDNVSCTDIDECELGISRCSHQCTNNVGSYVCNCPRGSKLAADKRTCIRVNYCAEANGGCSDICISDSYGLRCACFSGYTLDNIEKNCIDIDECAFAGSCEHLCHNTQGSYTCSCKVGFQLRLDGKTCMDINECNSTHGCQQICMNTQGSYTCECFEGYELSDDKATCKDIDECLIPNFCSHRCENTEGSYKCKCPPGFRLGKDSRSCLDVDECAEGKNSCSQICQNAIGGYSCSCSEGFEMNENGLKCIDLDECSRNNGNCSHTCQNLEGWFRCSCPKGLLLDKDGRTCITNNPCADNNGGCLQNCDVENDEAVCSCYRGFKKSKDNHFSCVDINECEDPLLNTCKNQRCVNTIGGFKCKCNGGFRKWRGVCIDINECDSFKSPCGDTMQCINTPGSFRCSCKPGYGFISEDGTKCTVNNVTCPVITSPLNGRMRCYNDDNNLISGTRCTFQCEKGFKLIGSTVRHCNISGLWEGKETKCIPAPCPRLTKPENGYFIPSTCTEGDSFPSDFCSLRCLSGFKPTGPRILTCTADKQWSPYNLPVSCNRKKPTVYPFINCPANINVELQKDELSAKVEIPKPKSNVEWLRYIDSEPEWAKNLNQRLKPGITRVIFKARNPTNETVVACTFSITVKDPEKPKVVFCPESFNVALNKGEMSRRIHWVEPEFSDNIGVHRIHRSTSPGALLSLGIHHVDYIATDESGNRASCHFTINVFEPWRNFAKDVRLTNGFMICPEKHIVKSLTEGITTIPSGCHLRWLKTKNHADPSNLEFKNKKINFHHYGDWNRRNRFDHRQRNDIYKYTF